MVGRLRYWHDHDSVARSPRKKTMRLDKALRRVVPSLSRLTYNGAFKLAVNGADILPRLLWREFRALPPNHLRIRVGVGNRLFNNQIEHLHGVRRWWIYALTHGYWNMNSTIVDIGCGCGRYALWLRDYELHGERFSGRYIGVDIDAEMIEWCRSHFDGRFKWLLATDASTSYVGGEGTTPYGIPEPDGSVDLVCSMSLYTHLLEEELVRYTRESFRLLRPGGVVNAYCFSLDHPPPTLGDRHTFAHRIGNAHVESLRQPHAAVAYTEDFLTRTFQAAGLERVHYVHEPNEWQCLIVAHKPLGAAEITPIRENLFSDGTTPNF